tara:strand:+ start:894 stop:1442 length:549 start_codon:yes stop_codon:yes gene_type:complete
MLLGSAGFFLLFLLAQPEVFIKKTDYNQNVIDYEFDSYMINISMLEFDKSGRLASKLDAVNTKRFKLTSRLEFEKPKLKYYASAKSVKPWQLKADKGASIDNGESAIFTDNVYAWKDLKDGKKNKLITEKLILYPNQQTVESDVKVRMISPNGESVGVGMKGNLETEVFELLSEVQGVYRGQ